MLILISSDIKGRIHGKNDFAEISKNLARYRFEDNFVGSSR